MNSMYAPIVGILIIIAAIILLPRLLNQDKKSKTQYDERQLFLRGRAYKLAFYTITVYECLCVILSLFGIEPVLPNYLIHFLGIFLSCLVLGCYCIWNDVYWGLNNDPKRSIIVFLALILINLTSLIPAIKQGTLWREGLGSHIGLNLMVLVMLVILLLVMLLKAILKDSQEEPDIVQDCEADKVTKSATEPSRQVETGVLEEE